MGIMIAAAELWKTTNLDNETLQDSKTWVTINESSDFGNFMGENRFKEDRKLVAKVWDTKDDKDTDVWCGFFFGCLRIQRAT
jgi:hypothetical protein